MKIETATQAKTHFGRMLDESQKEPILIQKSGRNVAVLLSIENYEQLSQIENLYWVAQAKDSESEGFMGTTDSQQLLEQLLNAED